VRKRESDNERQKFTEREREIKINEERFREK